MPEVRPNYDLQPLTAVRAIRAKCLDCCCWQVSEVSACPKTDCALHPYRMGKRPTGTHPAVRSMRRAKTCSSGTIPAPE